MGSFLCLAFPNSHATFKALMSTFALIFFVVNYIHSLNHASTINARYSYVRTNCFMPFYFLSYAFSPTEVMSLAFYWLKHTALIMIWYFAVIKYLQTSHQMISTFELHLLEFLFHFSLYTEEFWVLTLHRTHSCFVMKFFKAFVVKPIFTRFTFNWVD